MWWLTKFAPWCCTREWTCPMHPVTWSIQTEGIRRLRRGDLPRPEWQHSHAFNTAEFQGMGKINKRNYW
jgi:hypothetical protein